MHEMHKKLFYVSLIILRNYHALILSLGNSNIKKRRIVKVMTGVLKQKRK